MKRLIIYCSILIILTCAAFQVNANEKVGIGLSVNAQKLYGDTRSGYYEFGGSPFLLRYNVKPNIYLETDFLYSQLSSNVGGTSLGTQMINVGLKSGYRFFPLSRIKPHVYLGAGGFNYDFNADRRFWDFYGAAGVGLELSLKRNISVNLTGDFRYTTGDGFDGSVIGPGTDGFFTTGVGLIYYLGGKERTESHSPYEPNYDVSYDVVNPSDYSTNQINSTTNPEQIEHIAELTMKKSELITSLQKKEDEVIILQTKLGSLDKYYEMLMHRQELIDIESRPESAGELKVQEDFREALNLFETDQFEMSVDILKRLLRTNPEHYEASSWWYWLGENFYSLSEYDKAAKCFQWSLLTKNNGSKNEMAGLMYGLSQWKNGATEEALNVFKQLLRSTTDKKYLVLLNSYISEININHSLEN